MEQNTLQISALKRKRAFIKVCTRIRTYVESITQLTSETIANLEEKKERLLNYWSDYNVLQSEIESFCETEGDDRVSFEEAFYELTAKLRCVIANYNHTLSGSHDIYTSSVSGRSNQLRM